MAVTSAAANSTLPTTKAAARYQPGARRLAVIDIPPSLRHLGKVLHERVELSRLESVAEVRRHDAIREPLRHVGRRVDDRLLDERLVLAGEALVEVWPDAAARTGVGQRVAATAAADLGEHRLAVGRGGPAAGLLVLRAAALGGSRRAVAEPTVELRLIDHVRRLAHDGVTDPAQLGADDGVFAVRLGRDAQLRVDPWDGVDLHAERRHPEVLDHCDRVH